MGSSKHAKKTVAVDFDDVIMAEAGYIIAYSNAQWGHSLTEDDYTDNWPKMWGLEEGPELQRRIAAVHEPGFQIGYPLVEGVIEALQQLATRFRLVILTSRKQEVAQETVDWVDQHLPGIFSDKHFTGFLDDTGNEHRHTLAKGELAREIGADYLIDDQPRHCFAAAEAGVEAILFGDLAVGRGLELPPHVTRCKDWKAVLEYFDDIR